MNRRSFEPAEPLSEKYMLKKHGEGSNTICRELREIYQLTSDEEIKYKLRVAAAMAKAMRNALVKYKYAQ